MHDRHPCDADLTVQMRRYSEKKIGRISPSDRDHPAITSMLFRCPYDEDLTVPRVSMYRRDEKTIADHRDRVMRSCDPALSTVRRKSPHFVSVRWRSCGFHADEDRRSPGRHMASGKPFDRHHLSPKLRTCLIYDRVDSGPRDLSRLDGIRRPSSVHVA